MTGDDLREVMETCLPESVLREAVESAGLQQRERRLDPLPFLRAMVMSASSPSGGRQADVVRTYFEAGGTRVVRGSYYEWFGGPLEIAMSKLATIAMGYAADLPRDLPGILGGVKDWRIVDSTTVQLHKRLKEIYPGTGDYAAIKVHKTMSVGSGTTIAYHFSPAREHDSRHLALDESWRGFGLLIDLAYASIERLRDCERFGVRVVLRLKENWQPKVKTIQRGEVTRTFTPGTDLDVLLAEEVLLLNGKAIDAQVVVGSGATAVTMRLIGVVNPKGRYGFYLTNAPAATGPKQVADLYRVRWEIETNNKLDKSSHRLDEIDSRKPAAVRALLHASITASVLVGVLIRKHHLAEHGDLPSGARRTTAPLHAGLLARILSTCAMRIAELMDQTGPRVAAEWSRIAGVLVHMGEDPNWKRRPSILDEIRGWKSSVRKKPRPRPEQPKA